MHRNRRKQLWFTSKRKKECRPYRRLSSVAYQYKTLTMPQLFCITTLYKIPYIILANGYKSYDVKMLDDAITRFKKSCEC